MGITWLYFSFKGRIPRSFYWLFWCLPGILIMLFVDTLSEYQIGAGPLALPLEILWLWAGLAVTAKRLHDMNKSGWWQLIGLIPIIGWIPLFFACGFIRGTVGLNDYDDNQPESHLPEPEYQAAPSEQRIPTLRITKPPSSLDDK